MTSSNQSSRDAGVPAKAYLLLASLGLFWGLNWPIMKIALYEISPWSFRTLVLGLGGLGMLTLARFSGHKLSVPKDQLGPLLVVSFLNVTGWHLFSAFGVSLMPAGRASIIGFTMPLWAGLLSTLVLKERITWRLATGLIFGLSALGLLMGPDIAVLGAAPLGAGFMLIAAMTWGSGTVMLKKFALSLPVPVLTGWQLSIGTLPILVGALIWDSAPNWSAITAPAIWGTLYIVAFPMLYCHWAWFTVVSLFPASTAALGTLAVAVVGVFSSALILGEALGWSEVTALLLVVLSLATVLLKQD